MAVHVTMRNDSRSEDFIPLTELDEWEAIGVTKSCYSNTFENAIAA